MKPGQLGPKGVANIAALGGVVQSQKIKYDFKYHQQEFDCDLVSHNNIIVTCTVGLVHAFHCIVSYNRF